MENSTVILLGNGFDVACGYSTKYSDFYKDDFFKALVEKNHLARYIKMVNDQKENWSDLEMELYNYSTQMTSFQKGENRLEDTLSADPQDLDFIKDGFSTTKADELFQKEFEQLRYNLCRYIRKATSLSQTAYDPNFRPLVHNWFKQYPDATVISFNYTDCLTDNFSECKNVQHVHGRMMEENTSSTSSFQIMPAEKLNSDNIILGIDADTMPVKKTSHSFLNKSFHPRYAVENVAKKIEEASVFIIFGCSFGDTDAWYFNQILNINPRNLRRKIELYCHEQSGRNTILNNIQKFIRPKSLSTYRSENDVFIGDSSNCDLTLRERQQFYRRFEEK